MAEVLRALAVADAAAVLEELCARAATRGPFPGFAAVVGALARDDVRPLVERLREEAAWEPYPELGRLFGGAGGLGILEPAREDEHVPDYGAGRPLTLGERKAWARRPDRALVVRLLHDPHPAVVQRALANPRVTEDDVLTVATRRPGRPAVLRELSRTLPWCRRRRVRLALVLNPACPEDVAAPLLALLHRAELAEVVRATDLAPALRDAARSRLALQNATDAGA